MVQVFEVISHRFLQATVSYHRVHPFFDDQRTAIVDRPTSKQSGVA